MTYTPPTGRQEHAAEVLQARLSWPEAERFAAELDKEGVLESGDIEMAVKILAKRVRPVRRVEGLIRDLRMYGAMAKAEE